MISQIAPSQNSTSVDRAALRARLLALALVTTSYWASARIGLGFDPASGVATVVWPPSGIALAALLLGGTWLWPAVAAGAFAANLSIGVPVTVALWFATGNTTAAVVAARLLRRYANGQRALGDVQGTLAFVIFAAIFSTTIAATVGVTGGLIGNVVSAGDAAYTWRSWWIGDMLGVLLVTPPLLVVPRSIARWTGRRWIEAALALGLVAAVAVGIFGDRDPTGTTNLYFVFPALLIATLRLGQVGAALSALLASGIAVVGTAAGRGPLAGGPLGEGLLELQQFMAIAAVTMLILGAALAESADDRRRLARRVSRRTRQVRALGQALTLVEQQERTRLSQLLHDDLQQVLFALVMRLGIVREALAQGEVQLADDEIAETDRLTRHAIGITRMTVAHLSPPELSAEGLSEGLRMLAESMQSDHRLSVTVEIEADDAPVTADMQLLILKIVRELLFNIVKHAEVDHARVSLAAEPSSVTVIVSDHGRGLDPAAVDRSGSFGLRSIRERLDLIDGRLTVSGEPGRGSRVSIQIPLVSRDSADRDDQHGNRRRR